MCPPLCPARQLTLLGYKQRANLGKRRTEVTLSLIESDIEEESLILPDAVSSAAESEAEDLFENAQPKSQAQQCNYVTVQNPNGSTTSFLI